MRKSFTQLEGLGEFGPGDAATLGSAEGTPLPVPPQRDVPDLSARHLAHGLLAPRREGEGAAFGSLEMGEDREMEAQEESGEVTGVRRQWKTTALKHAMQN